MSGVTRRALAGVVLALGACSSGQPESLRTLTPGTLRIGTYFVNPPFEYVSNGQRIGFEVDLMNEIARRLALTPVFVDTQWETILQQMQAGQYDVIVGGITITPEREKSLAWSVPYMTTTLSIVVDSGSLAADPQHRRPQVGLGGRAGGDHRLRRRRQDAAERPDRQRKGLLVRPHPGRHGRPRRGPHHGGDEGLSGGRLARPADARSQHRGAGARRSAAAGHRRWARTIPACSPRSIARSPT